MCGIAGVYLLDDSLKVNLDALLDTMLDAIEHRGGDATGFVAFGNEGVLEWQKAACGARDFATYRRPVPKGTRTILAHTRWATQGLPAFVENNHPLRRGSFFAIHNGHISNDHELFQLAGREPYGQVDSEAVPARLASLGKLGALGRVMEEIHGAAAIAAVDEKNPKDLALARGHSSPLFVLRTKKIVLFGSTEQTVRSAYEQHIGAVPKRAKIVAQKQGTLLLWRDGKLKQSQFKPYSPPKVVWASKGKGPNVTLPWKEVLTEGEDTLGVSDTDVDWAECDSCGVVVAWDQVRLTNDERGFTEQLCSVCAGETEELDWTPIHAEVQEDFSEINEAALQRFLAEHDSKN